MLSIVSGEAKAHRLRESTTVSLCKIRGSYRKFPFLHVCACDVSSRPVRGCVLKIRLLSVAFKVRGSIG
jgi:hypothetical protein